MVFNNLDDLIHESIQRFMDEPSLIETTAKSALFVGDTHGAVDVTQKVLREYRGVVDLIVFLGDYVDRSDTGLDNLGLILTAKLRDPEHIIVLRGNHESPITNYYYGFYEEILAKLGSGFYNQFVELFSVMPYSIKVNGVLGLHGGIPRDVEDLSRITEIQKGDEEPRDPIAFQILWNDPSPDIRGFEPSPRGSGIYLFGMDVAEKFLKKNELYMLVRGHEVCPEGYRIDFNGLVITVFSSRYHGGYAGALLVKDNNELRFLTL
ncbi:MAG: metallophosphoesterase [Thermoprotei archaeon]